MAIRTAYEHHGVCGFYLQHGTDYRNPHEPIVRELVRRALRAWSLDTSHVLDLACGSGEVTLALGDGARVDGVDPYTASAYRRRTGRTAEALSFEQIAAGALTGRRYSLIVCSFALHLVEESRLPVLAYRLAEVAPTLLVLTPHKRPVLAWTWRLADEIQHARVRARLYRSCINVG